MRRSRGAAAQKTPVKYRFRDQDDQLHRKAHQMRGERAGGEQDEVNGQGEGHLGGEVHQQKQKPVLPQGEAEQQKQQALDQQCGQQRQKKGYPQRGGSGRLAQGAGGTVERDAALQHLALKGL